MNRLALWAAVALFVGAGCAPATDPRVPGPEGTGYVTGPDGVRLYYRVEGSGSDTVVVVHGGPGAGMDAVRPDFGPLSGGRTVIYYDQRGGGRSTLPADTMLLGPEHFAGDLEAVRRHFGLGQMDIVAHSFGAAVVAEYARRYPNRLGRVVLLGAVGPRRAATTALIREQYAETDTALLRRAFEPMAALLTGTAEDPVAACRAYQAAIAAMAVARGEPSSTRRGGDCLMNPEALGYYFRYTAKLGPELFGNWDYTASLGSLSEPLLVIYGSSDPRALAIQREWAAAVPQGRILAIEGAGKEAHVDRPEVVFSAIAAFLNGRWPEGAERVP